MITINKWLKKNLKTKNFKLLSHTWLYCWLLSPNSFIADSDAKIKYVVGMSHPHTPLLPTLYTTCKTNFAIQKSKLYNFFNNYFVHFTGFAWLFFFLFFWFCPIRAGGVNERKCVGVINDIHKLDTIKREIRVVFHMRLFSTFNMMTLMTFWQLWLYIVYSAKEINFPSTFPWQLRVVNFYTRAGTIAGCYFVWRHLFKQQLYKSRLINRLRHAKKSSTTNVMSKFRVHLSKTRCPLGL